MNEPTITLKQKRMYDFIDGFCRQNGFSPTLREIEKGMGYGCAAAVYTHLRPLQKKGLITCTPGKARTLRIIEQEASC